MFIMSAAQLCTLTALTITYLSVSLTQGQLITRPPQTHKPIEANGLLYNLYYVPGECMDPHVMVKGDFNGGLIIENKRVIMKEYGPYTVQGNIEVAPSGCLVIMPGVEMFFNPGYGMIINGTLIARGTPEPGGRITMTKSPDKNNNVLSRLRTDARLVDGNTTKDGRLDMMFAGQWQGVCTKHRNFSAIDVNVTCAHLGFVYGNFTYHSFARNGTDYMLYERPGCTGQETSLFDCPGSADIKVGAHVCDGQQVVGLECEGLRPDLFTDHWRGLEFYNTTLTQVVDSDRMLFFNRTNSYLEYVDISYAGLDIFRGYRMFYGRASISASPYVPLMNNITVSKGAYDGLNLTEIRGDIHIANSSITDNRGYGLFIQTAVGRTLINKTTIDNNWADGLKMYMVNYTINEFNRDFRQDDSFCRTPSVLTPSFPILLHENLVDYRGDKPIGQVCRQRFSTKRGQMVSLHILVMERDPEASGKIIIQDGWESGPKLLEMAINNGSFPATVTTRTNVMWITFEHSVPYAPSNDRSKRCKHLQSCIRFLMEITTDKGPDTELRLYESSVTNNMGYGVNIQDMRSKVHINSSEISGNGYGAGLRVYQGSGEVGVNNTVIRNNAKTGVNITYAGGYQMFNLTTISDNQGYGMITEYLQLNQSRFELMQRLEIVGSVFERNQWTALRVGNYCRGGEVFVNETSFLDNLHDAIEYLSCNVSAEKSTNFSLAFNTFVRNKRHSVLMMPLLNSEGIFTNNTFRDHKLGVIRVDNGYDFVESRWYSKFPVNYRMFENVFENNMGQYCVNFRLTQNSPVQQLDFKFNTLINNEIQNSFMYLNPRSRANAVIIVSSGNIRIQRNHIYNPQSVRDIATHLIDPSVTIMAERNWWQTTNHAVVHGRIFDQDDRYNLATFKYHPVLMENWLYGSYDTSKNPEYRWDFQRGLKIGGVLDGTFRTDPRIRTYHVDRDIVILKDSTLIILPGTTLEFESSIGMIVHGRLEVDGARINPPQSITFTLKEDNFVPIANRTMYEYVRLIGGKDEFEGRLEINKTGEWGTVCRNGWTEKESALVCHQLGLTFNPAYGTPVQTPIIADDTVPIWLSEVECDMLDTDIRDCQSLKKGHFVCEHVQDVTIRCQSPTWSGVTIPANLRFGTTFETQIRHLVIDKAGLLDFQEMSYTPGLRIDYNFYSISFLTVKNCMSDGVSIKYSNPYSENLIEHLNLENNLGNGLLTRSPFLNLRHLFFNNNERAGLVYDPFFTEYEALSVRNFIHKDRTVLMMDHSALSIGDNSMRFITCAPGKVNETQRVYYREYKSESSAFKLTIQILDYNPLTSIEKVTVYDSERALITGATRKFEIEEDLIDFPVVSQSRYLTVKYEVNGIQSGRLAYSIISVGYNEAVIKSRISVFNATIQNNERGIVTKHYNNPSNERMEIFHRAKAEEISFEAMLVQNNRKEAMFIPSLTKYHEKLIPTIEEMTRPEKVGAITYIIKQAKFLDNGKGIHGEHNHVDFANNVWKWHVTYTEITGCKSGGFEIELPRVNDLYERQIHEVTFNESKVTNNAKFSFAVNGYYANVSIQNNNFRDNKCLTGLITLTGMEKGLIFRNNRLERNYGKYVVNFHLESHSEYNEDTTGVFVNNILTANQYQQMSEMVGTTNIPVTFSLAITGVQNIDIRRNVFENPTLQFELVAGITSLSLHNKLQVKENYWGTSDQLMIKKRIFDFDDWNNYAIADYFPYLTIPNIQSGLTTDTELKVELDLNYLGGRITQDLTLPIKNTPYVVYSDLTVMPGVTFTIQPGTELQFHPNIGILVLGKLMASGVPYNRIKLGPVPIPPEKQVKQYVVPSDMIRLKGGVQENEGFLELYNTSSLTWNMMCDSQFNEKTAEVVCRELGLETVNVRVRFSHLYDHYVYGKPMYFLKEFWAYSYYCLGSEESLDLCMKRVNYNIKPCIYTANYTFIRCGERNLPRSMNYWGNIRFAASNYEEDIVSFVREEDRSQLEYVDITGAGFLHGEKVGAIQTTYVNPIMRHINISQCASNGIDIIAPRHSVDVSNQNIYNNLGYGVNVLALNGDSTVSAQSSFDPLVTNTVPYNLYGLVEICRMEKEIQVKNRMLLFYKYSQRAVDCVKIVRGSSSVGRKKVALRFLQFGLFHDDFYRNAVEIFDGSTVTTTNRLAELTANSTETEIKTRYMSTQDSLTIHIHASPSYGFYGFVAEIVTIPLSGLTYPDSSYKHKLEQVILTGNQEGALLYKNVGEINPSLIIDHCWIEKNGVAILNLTSNPSIDVNLQSTLIFNMENNFINHNKGGMFVRATTPSVATKLVSSISNNIFAFGSNGDTIKLTGHHFERFRLFENYIYNSTAGDYHDVVHVQNVVVNFTFNTITQSVGYSVIHALNTENTEATQLYQKNFIHDNNATAVYRAAIRVASGNPKINTNFLVNTECDFELISRPPQKVIPGLPVNDIPIDATQNWWGSTSLGYISGKIWDQTDNASLARVNYNPFKPTNESLIYGKCAPGWIESEGRCYKYMGGALPYLYADSFCKENGGFLAESNGREKFLKYLLYLTQNNYNANTRVWVYADVAAGRCSSFENDYIVAEMDCFFTLRPFICERDPYINPPGSSEFILVAIICGAVFGFVLIVSLIFLVMWRIKSNRRKDERIERASTIRSSFHGSVRSRSTLSVNALMAGGSKRHLDTASMASSRYGYDDRSLNASMASLRGTDEEMLMEEEEQKTRRKLRQRAEWASGESRQNGALRRGLGRSRERVDDVDVDSDNSVNARRREKRREAETYMKRNEDLDDDEEDEVDDDVDDDDDEEIDSDVDEKTKLFDADSDASSFNKAKYKLAQERERERIPLKPIIKGKYRDDSASEKSKSSSEMEPKSSLPLNIPTTPVKHKPAIPVKPPTRPTPVPRSKPIPASRSREHLSQSEYVDESKISNVRDSIGSGNKMSHNQPDLEKDDLFLPPPPPTFYSGSQENLSRPLPPIPTLPPPRFHTSDSTPEMGSGVEYLPRSRNPSKFDPNEDTDRSDVEASTPLLKGNESTSSFDTEPGSEKGTRMYKKNMKKNRSRDNLYEKRANELKLGSRENLTDALVFGKKKSRSRESLNSLKMPRKVRRSRERISSNSSQKSHDYNYDDDYEDDRRAEMDYRPRRPSDPGLSVPYVVSPPIVPTYSRNQSVDNSSSGVDLMPRDRSVSLSAHTDSQSKTGEGDSNVNDLNKPPKRQKSIETMI